ncbi:MAG: DUF1553 domain-containing protein [Prosthecobacter sp.]
MIAKFAVITLTGIACHGCLRATEPWDFQHWSFQTVKAQHLPDVKDRSWSRTRVDHFILAKMEAAGLKPAPPADADTLTRRLWFDLVGLPPDGNSVEASVLVEQLLASSHFGERWARHWLDVARYAESSGNTRNMAYVLAWKYRNYVIRAFNRDVPFDQFVREQIAGDLLPNASDEQLLATGFLNVGTRSLGEQDLLLYEMNLADDLIDTTCHAFLALSANCARCHDHKFDPIPTRDYYALAGIFRSTKYLSGVETNNRAESAAAMPLGPDGMKRMKAVKNHEKKLAEMTQEYVEMAKKRNSQRDELVMAGVDPVKMPKDLPAAMMPKVEALLKMDKAVEDWKAKLALMQTTAPSPPATGMACQESDTFINCPVMDKGDHKQPLAAMTRGALSVLPVKLAPIGEKESGRKQLADWIANKDNPLTARVIVNRVWLKLMGRGLVDTPDDFGKLGAKPTHPELLDDLALRFMQNGWSVKWLVREITRSAVYQQGTATTEQGVMLYAGREPKRLEAEVIRDAMLSLSGALEQHVIEGSQVEELAKPVTPQGRELGRKNFLNNVKEDLPVRSIYLPVLRGSQTPMMQCFNAADPASIVGQRSNGIVPAQALLLMNSDFVMQQAEGFAKRTESEHDAVARLRSVCRSVFHRTLTNSELSAMMRSLDCGMTWPQLCHVLMQSAEFQTLH